MRYNPEIHNRQSIRLRGYDYTRAGAYFVTVCTHGRRCLFGEIGDGVMHPNDIGRIVAACWAEIPAHFPHAALDAFVVMPNHVHGIVWLRGDDRHDTSVRTDRRWGRWTPVGAHIGPVGAQHAAPLQMPAPLQNAPESIQRRDVPGAVGMIVRSFKSAATKRINEQNGQRGTTPWQRNYYEHIIRDAVALRRIRVYIAKNPARWTTDDLFNSA